MFDLEVFNQQLNTLYNEHNNEKIEECYNKAYEQICKELDEILQHIVGCCGSENLPEEYQEPYAYLSKCAVHILNDQTGFYRGINAWKKCEEAFHDLYQILLNINQLHTLNHAVILLNHATTLQMQGKQMEAENRFAEAKQILEQEGEKTVPFLWAGFYNNRAPLYLDEGKPEKALADQKKAIEYLQKSVGLEGRDAAITYSAMAVTSDLCDKLEEAEDYANKAIAIFEKLGSDGHFGAALQAKARVCYRRGQYQEAAELFQKAADDTKLYFGENKEYQVCIANRDKARSYL